MIQEDQAKGEELQEQAQAEASGEGAEGDANYSDAWDELDAKETGQPSEAEGRQDEGDEPPEGEEDEAGQGSDKDAPPSADAEPASREESTDDESDPVKLREALKAEREARERAENLARSHGGRLAQKLSELNDLKKQLEGDKAKGSTPAGEEATEEDERIKQLKEDYPEVAEPFLEKFAKIEGEIRALREGQGGASNEASPEAEAEALFKEQFDALTERHDDFVNVVQSQEYGAWVSRQSPLVQRVLQENSPRIVNAAECAEILTRFKDETGWGKNEAAEKLEQKRERQLRAGTEAKGGQPAVTHDSEGSYEDEWDRLDRLERQRSVGRR